MGPLADGCLLETFGSLDAGLAALECATEAVLSFTVRPDGALLDGTPSRDAVRAARSAGAIAVGFNCGQGPEDAVRAVRDAEAKGLWLRPAGEPGDPRALARAIEPVRDRCAVIGGCCGAGPDALRDLGAARWIR